MTFDPQTVRLDEWALSYLAPTAKPGEYARTGSVFRGMADESKARAYADTLAAFFVAQGCPGSVFVVRGPTSTTRKPFEVVSASCGYPMVYRAGVAA